MYLLNGKWYNIDIYSDDTEVFYVDGDQNITDTYILGSMRNHIYFLETTNVMSMYGHVLPVAYIYDGTPVSDTDTIRIRIWNNITSPMYYYNGYWHYVSPSSPDVLVKRLTNVVAMVSSEETVFLADGNIVSFALTYDSIFYATDTGSVKQIPLAVFDKNDDSETDVETDTETDSGEDTEQGTESEQIPVEKDIYSVESDSEIIVGMGARDDRVFYELYNTADGSYSYRIAGDFYDSVDLPKLDENMILSGIDGNSRVMDLLDNISKTGIVSRYDAYNSLKVTNNDKMLTLVQFLSTGSKLILNDNTEYTIVVRGDVVSGSNITIIDILSVMNYIIGADTEFSDIQMLAMDYDGVDGVNVADLALMYKALFNSELIKDTDTKFGIKVNGGSANIGGVLSTESSHNTQINIVADIPAGMVFDKWVVVSGDVNIVNIKSASTYFMMPYEAVEVTATFKAASIAMDDIIFDDVKEWYTEVEPKAVSFTNTGDVGLTNLFVSLESGSEYFDLITYSLPYYLESGASNNISYAIQPKTGLWYGTYTAEIVLNATELDSEVRKTVSFTVEHICLGTSIAGKIADCAEDGWKNYYKCACGKHFTDATISVEITDLEAWKKGEGKIPAYGHVCGLLAERVDPIHTETELSDGMEAHYFCYICRNYLNEAKEVVSEESLVIPAPEHVHHRYDYDESGHWSVCECGAFVDGSSEGHNFCEDGSSVGCLDCGYEMIIGYTVSGQITSYLAESSEIVIELINEEGIAVYRTMVNTYVEVPDDENACLSIFSIDDVVDGTYTLRVSKIGHVTTECTIIVDGSPASLDIVLELIDTVPEDDTVTETVE